MARISSARVLADFALGAVRARQDEPFVTWLGATGLDPHGAGRVELAALRRILPRARASRAMRSRFIRGRGGGYVYFASAVQVARLLGLQKVRSTGFVVPLERLLVGAALRRARLVFGAFAALQRGKPVSAVAIAAEVEVSRRSVLHWRKITHWPRRQRLALHGAAVTPGLLRWLRVAQPGPWRIVRRRGRLRLGRRLPNALVQIWPAENRKWLSRRINAALPATLAPRVLHSAPAASHLAQPQAYAIEGNLASFSAVDPAPPNCQREGEDLERGSGGTP